MLFDRYRVLKKLGEGGNGRTYLVYDRKLGKIWAMKEWKENGEPEEEFWKECRILRDLDSPFFPRIVECFREGGKRYLLMDWIRGITLEEKLLAEGPLPWETAVSYAVQLCEALETLHAGEFPVLHLDLKPSNIMVTRDGLRLIDFGSAAVRYESGGRLQNRYPAGTPGFAPPELLRAEEVDERSDIYSLGAVLWVMLTGERRDGKKEKEARNRGAGMPEDLPEKLRKILERAMQERKEERFQSADEMRRSLEQMKEEGNGKTTRRRRAAAACIAGLAVFVCVSAAGMMKAGTGRNLSAERKKEALETEAGSALFPETEELGIAAGKTGIYGNKRFAAVSGGSLWNMTAENMEKKRLFHIQTGMGRWMRQR